MTGVFWIISCGISSAPMYVERMPASFLATTVAASRMSASFRDMLMVVSLVRSMLTVSVLQPTYE